jgi:hypothetical protein
MSEKKKKQWQIVTLVCSVNLPEEKKCKKSQKLNSCRGTGQRCGEGVAVLPRDRETNNNCSAKIFEKKIFGKNSGED